MAVLLYREDNKMLWASSEVSELRTVGDMSLALHFPSLRASPAVYVALLAAAASWAAAFVQLIGIRRVSKDVRQVTRDTVEIARVVLDEQRQRLDRTLAEERAQALHERFAAVAARLGAEKPQVRLAAVYAMAAIADDWVENKQACINVLCACLKMSSQPDPSLKASAARQQAYRAEWQVREAIVEVISAHLRGGSDHAQSWLQQLTRSLSGEKAPGRANWCGLNFDFTGVRFDRADFSGAYFSGGHVSFRDARFCEGRFGNTRFTGGHVDFTGAHFSGPQVSFSGARFSGGHVDL